MLRAETSFDIADRSVGRNSPCLIVAEVAQAHEGSVALAHSFVNAAAAAGADAIKFQTHIADAESTRDEPFRVPFPGRQDLTRFDYWRRMEFTPEQWAGLAKHARDSGVLFLSTPFSLEAVDLLEAIGCPAWKIGSGEVSNFELLEACGRTRKPILLSSGMSPWAELDAAVACLRGLEASFGVFQCTSSYPTRLEEVGLNLLAELTERYAVPVGLSDHSGTPYPALAAIARGAAMLEVHVTFDRTMFSPDAAASLSFAELAHVVQARDAIFAMDASPVSKEDAARRRSDMRALFNKSLALRSALAEGHVLRREDLVPKKPGSGIPLADADKIIGRTLRTNVAPDRVLTWDDIV